MRFQPELWSCRGGRPGVCPAGKQLRNNGRHLGELGGAQQRSLGSERCREGDFPHEWGSWLDTVVRKGEVIGGFLYKGHDVSAESQIIISIAKKACQIETI